MIIAIDGPAGSGKSTIAKLVSKRLGFLYIDTGAMYRSLTLKAMQKKLDLNDEATLITMAKNTKIELNPISLDGKDVSDKIRTLEVTNNISYIANIPGVRAEMVKLQRAVGRGSQKGAVLEGRDIGTVVFPDAEKKFYLDASVEERARRRFKELSQDGIKVDLARLQRDIEIRDAKDKARPVGALKKAQDAILVDTTNLTIEEVVKKVLSYL
ncbi:MAG: cytidylate kinase [Candidatus Omnitrophica bacterium CG1_02_43_210]|nr:MAG: cytidylate kinase [Candidatus Omnitrophica bacterium CG1_02_43_210]